MSSESSTSLRSVTRSRPCEVCGGDHKCSYSADGLILCGRRQGEQPGFHWLGPAKNDPQWHLYRAVDGSAVPLPPPPKPSDVNWSKEALHAHSLFGEKPRRYLSQLLDLPEWVLTEMWIGVRLEKDDDVWTFPEHNANGEVVGIMRRYTNGDKRALGHRGLSIPRNWRERGGPVLVPEGASDTLALTALDLCAVGRPSATGGVEMLTDLLGRVGSRPIIVLGENDRKPDGSWPGRDGAVQVAAKLQEKLRRPVRWVLPPDEAKDARAWVLQQRIPPPRQLWQEAGIRLLRALEAAAQPVTEGERRSVSSPVLQSTGELTLRRSPEQSNNGGGGESKRPPLPLITRPVAPPFPVDVFPPPVAAFCTQAADALSCPVDFVAVPLLVLSGALLGRAWVFQLTPQQVYTANVYAAIVGDPGTAKSPALNLLTQPLDQLDWESQLAFPEIKRQWECEAEDLRGEAPLLPRIRLDDFTMESLGPTLRNNPRGVCIVKDELSGLIHSFNQYRGGRGQDRQVLLQAWSGSCLKIDRKGQGEDGPILAMQPFLSIVGGVQPTVLECLQTRTKGKTIDDGFLDRFLFAYPEKQPMHGERWKAIHADVAALWTNTVRRLRAVEPRTPGSAWEGQVLPLAEAARPLWERITEAHAVEMNAEDFPVLLRGPWVKLQVYLARLTLILQGLHYLFETAGNQAIEGPMVEASERLLTYFKGHARKVYSAMGHDGKIDQALTVLRWLQRHPEIVQFKRYTAWQAMRRSFENGEELKAILEYLQEADYLRRVGQATWEVNKDWDRTVIAA